MLLIKIIGVMLIAFAGAAYGFSAAALLEKRVAELREIYSGSNTLKELIRSGSGELSYLLGRCYENCGSLEVEGAEVRVLKGVLKAEDTEILEDFFRSLGGLDCEGEYSRICVFESLLKAQYQKAQLDAAKKSRLIKTLGISAGLALGILII